ncbi:hypothetical protein [Pelomonas aquatica]|jgi:hypothetical protein|uniref:Uncharacterized protein n=1 Tax=Pelomonas aquatica TaxID=431058 RepID=A0A9X4LMP5_9BURK|nr:hypothetical protein [Pelomonas aquatica]MCY4754668.1 hypothetical protein [Pelomonas aquatica]MDG0863755.1 hypothetical protein [Pelomonas aquatica]
MGFDALQPKDWIAVYAAGLSTILGFVKGWELFRDRFRFEVSYSFTGDEDEGNRIFIRNLAGKPIILTYWDLLYCKGYGPFRTYEGICSPDYYSGDTQIGAHSTLTLTFCEEDYFDWSHKVLKDRRIFIRLRFAGRGEYTRLVYAGS